MLQLTKDTHSTRKFKSLQRYVTTATLKMFHMFRLSTDVSLMLTCSTYLRLTNPLGLVLYVILLIGMPHFITLEPNHNLTEIPGWYLSLKILMSAVPTIILTVIIIMESRPDFSTPTSVAILKNVFSMLTNLPCK